MPNAIVLREHGTSSVLKLEDIIIEKPKKDQLLIRHTAIGVHFHDIYVRTGLYKSLDLPGIPGIEAVGIIEDLGSEVKNFDIGDRIVYITSKYGAYSSHRILNANLAIKLPEFVSDELIATNFSRVLTVIMLLQKVVHLRSNQSILVTAATGGVGKLLCQWANNIGSLVIGSVSTMEKVKLAKTYGCKYCFTYDKKNFVSEIMEITNGKGVNIVFDSVGLQTFESSINCLSLCGHLVNFGQSSGVVKPLNMSILSKKSLTFSRPILFHYLTNSNTYKTMARSVFKSFNDRFFKLPNSNAIYLENASQAHEALESRFGGGSIYLKP